MEWSSTPDTMTGPVFYFAYGSNMNTARMKSRCPGAVYIGIGTLKHYMLTERLYADIDYCDKSSVQGVLYMISACNLHSLDLFEGFPKTYFRMLVDIECGNRIFHAVTYQMTPPVKALRDGQPYTENYRQICSDGAKFHHITNKFTTRRTKNASKNS